MMNYWLSDWITGSIHSSLFLFQVNFFVQLTLEILMVSGVYLINVFLDWSPNLSFTLIWIQLFELENLVVWNDIFKAKSFSSPVKMLTAIQIKDFWRMLLFTACSNDQASAGWSLPCSAMRLAAQPSLWHINLSKDVITDNSTATPSSQITHSIHSGSVYSSCVKFRPAACSFLWWYTW